MALDRDNGFGEPVSEQKILDHIHEATQRKGAVIGIIDGDFGEIAATVAVAFRQPWYSTVWRLQEGWVFVRPEYRKRGYFRDLFLFMKWYRDQMRAKDPNLQLYSSVWSHKNLPLKLRLWGRFGTQVGGIFRMD